MAVEYGTSPPCITATPTSLHSSESEIVFFPEKDSKSDIQKGPLRKCMSENFAKPSDESEADFIYSTPRPTASVIHKKIHIPFKENKKLIVGTWHGVRDQRQPSSETKSNISAAAKGHKRSQSDMGVGALRTSDISFLQDVTSQYCIDGASPAAVKSPVNDSDDKTVQRSQRGKHWKYV